MCCLQAFQPEPNNCGANTRMQGVSDLAQQLLQDACQGSDPPLVMALPHTRSLSLYSSQGVLFEFAAAVWQPTVLLFLSCCSC
jgi:hypothetical protein